MKLIYMYYISFLQFQMLSCMRMNYAMKNNDFVLRYKTFMLRGRSSLRYINDKCIMKSQLPGMSTATCSNPTRELL